jgi:hypothetical protein
MSSVAALVTVNRIGGAAGVATVSYTTINGTATAGADYSATIGSVTWQDGDATAKTISVPVNSNAAGKAFGVALTAVAGAADFGSPTSAIVAMSSSAGTGTATGAAPSASGTMIPSATQIIDSALDVWTVSGGVVMENGKSAGLSANVALLLYYRGGIYQENKTCLWWSWNGSSWSSTSNPAPSVTPACSAGAAAAPPVSSSSSSGGSSFSGATGSPAALLSYINSLSGQTKHILSGQHSSYWDSNPLDYLQAETSQTGKTVAILGTTSGQEGSTQKTVSVTNAWLAQGGIPLVSWWPIDPFTNTNDDNRGIDFAQLTQPGTAAYISWYKLLDNQIAILKQINGPVLYRPLVELNGNWNWWGARDTATFITVWKQMHDYFVSKGVDNVLWVYNVNTGSGKYSQYYPGSSYVDIIAMDAYPPSKSDLSMYNAITPLGKPIMYAEMGVDSPFTSGPLHSGDYSVLLATIQAGFPKVFAAVVWCQTWALSEQSGAAAFMNNPAIISLSDLPSGLVDP